MFGGIFEYEYIGDDFGNDLDNTIIYTECKMLRDYMAFKAGDVIPLIWFKAAKGTISFDGKLYIALCPLA
jgi:hypothetical protein